MGIKAPKRDPIGAKYLFYKITGYDDGDGILLNEFVLNNSITSIISNIKKLIK